MLTPIPKRPILTLRRAALRRALSLTAAALLCAPAQAQTSAKGDEVLLEMAAAFKRADKTRLTQLLPQARNHPLEPWAAYWEIKARLGEASAREVQDFMARYRGSYQEDRLRNDWLLLLGERRDWSAFAAEVPNYRMRDDRQVQCYQTLIFHLQNAQPANDPALEAARAAATAAGAAQVRAHWLAQRDLEDGCAQAVERLLTSQWLTPEVVWRKARLAIEAKRTGVASQAVTMLAPQATAQVQALAGSAAKYLATQARTSSKLGQELTTLALVKLAADDTEGAAYQLQNKWASQLSPAQANWVWGVLGKQAAQNLSPTALTYFANVTQGSDLPDEALAWNVRAALRAGNGPRWPLVIQATSAMSEAARKDPAWVYWRARALHAQKDPAQAQALYESIAAPSGFYELLAQEELGRPISAPPRPEALTAQELQAAKDNPGLNRALYAILIGLRPEGVREWNYAAHLVNAQGQSSALAGPHSDRELLAAAQLACNQQVWDRCINTSERTRSLVDVAQRYPLPFKDAVVKRSREIGLDPAYVYGLIRQESRFIMDARSSVGASGLMQVMPATARWTAKKIGLAGFTADQITRQDVNIAIGTGYLKLVLDDFAGSLPLAAAAYNAGPGRPRKWRAPGEGGTGPVLEAAIWAENIPFTETRDYVKKVLANTTLYAALIAGQPQSLKARLGTVGPKEASAAENRELP
ncbi:MAG: transglycosylase SLT domain-containing protein [Burkholderiaceae bacterium]